MTVRFPGEEGLPMLFDDMLRSIKPRATTFKIADRGGMYVPPCGVRPFRAYRAPTERC